MKTSRNIWNSRVLLQMLCLAGFGLTGCGQMPVSDAGADGTAEPGQTVQLNGSRSFSPDGSALSYSWAGMGSASTVAMLKKVTPPIRMSANANCFPSGLHATAS